MAKRNVTRFNFQAFADYMGAVFIIPGMLIADVRAKAKGWRVDPECSFHDLKRIEEKFDRGHKTYYRYAGKTWITKDAGGC